MTAVRLLIIVVVGLLLAACGGTGSRTRAAFPADSTMARIEQRGTLIVGIKFDQPLFGYKDPETGRITGFDAEIARMIAAGITGSERNVQFIETVSRNREDFLERGVIDIVVGTYSITAERRQRVAFTAPYYYAGQDVLVRAEDKTISGVAALAGKRVCSGTGSTSLDRLRSQIPRARLVVVDVYSECMPALIDGQVDAISTDDTILLGLMSRYPNQVRLLRKPFAREPYGIGVHRGDTAFRDYLNGLLGGYLRDGGWDRAFRDTIGTVGVTATVARPSVG